MEVGVALHEAQRKSGISVEKIAKASQLSRSGIHKVFAGNPPTLHSLYKICKAMNTKPGICIVGVCTEAQE